MNRDQRWITDAFLAELENLKRGESAPMDVTSKRLAMCDMILTDLHDAILNRWRGWRPPQRSKKSAWTP